MRGYDVIHELYRGNLRPCDRSFRQDTDFAITMDAFTTHEKWLRENLNGEAVKRFDELVSCHNNIVDTSENDCLPVSAFAHQIWENADKQTIEIYIFPIKCRPLSKEDSIGIMQSITDESKTGTTVPKYLFSDKTGISC